MDCLLNDIVVPDDMIAFVIGKVFLPSAAICEQALLDAVYFIPLPGDPSCDAYELILPQWMVPFVIGLGRVTSSFPTSTDGQNSLASVSCSEYVWDGKMSSKLMCNFDDSLLPGYRISSFPCNSLIQFFGTIKDVVSSGGMTIDVKSIVMDVDHISSLGKRKSPVTEDNSPFSPTCSFVVPSMRNVCNHVAHPSSRITHPLCNIGLEVDRATKHEDVGGSPKEESCFFLL
ncbi:hypothetical protein EDC04DRAFT_2915080 [Pisolithus marmoratus]|nr:hypothetical protein EDC04DRAFT_2915080 [Pisolithus marmoratus]